MIWVYVSLGVVTVLAMAVIVGTALSRLGDDDLDEHDEAVDEAEETSAVGEARDRAKLRHPSAHQPAAPAPGYGRGQAPRRVSLPRPRAARER